MTITEQERKDMVAIFNAQDAAAKLRSADVTIQGVKVTCYETGEIERTHQQSGKLLRGFGGSNGDGYLQISVMKKSTLSHRLVYAAFNGEIPKGMHIDHIDGDKQNNALENLRILNCQDNNRAHRDKKRNASSKYRGVYWHSRDKRWRATIGSSYIGSFDSEAEAARAYDAAARKLNYLPEALNF